MTKNKQKAHKSPFDKIKILEGNVFYTWKLQSELDEEKKRLLRSGKSRSRSVRSRKKKKNITSKKVKSLSKQKPESEKTKKSMKMKKSKSRNKSRSKTNKLKSAVGTKLKSKKSSKSRSRSHRIKKPEAVVKNVVDVPTLELNTKDIQVQEMTKLSKRQKSQMNTNSLLMSGITSPSKNNASTNYSQNKSSNHTTHQSLQEKFQKEKVKRVLRKTGLTKEFSK